MPKRKLVQMALHLLRYNALEQLHTYVHCVSEPDEPPATSPSSDSSIARMQLFRRLRPMFYGEHHLEEIMWQERLGREQIEDLLEAYEEHLVSCVTPEASP